MNNTRMTISSTTSNGTVFGSNLSFTYLMEEVDDGNYTCEWVILTTNGSESVELQASGKLLLFVFCNSTKFCYGHSVYSVNYVPNTKMFTSMECTTMPILIFAKISA